MNNRLPATPSNFRKSNIDPVELAKFAAFSAHWWDREGDLKALHDINPLRVAYVNRRSPLAGKRVLDVGCGGGLLTEAMARMGAAVSGIDAGEAPLAVARTHAAEGGLTIEYTLATAEEFAFRHPRRYEAVTCMELLEHVPSPVSVVKACSTLAADGGDVFFATLNRNPKSFLFAIIGAEYLLGLVRRGTHRYRAFIKPAELAAWATDAGLRHADSRGLHYNPFSGRYRLGGNLHVNYLMHFKKAKCRFGDSERLTRPAAGPTGI